MSKRNERREAERAARKLTYQLHLADATIDPAAIEAKPVVQPKPISTAQMEANRANAQVSRGPVTPEGKAISARNNTRHGLAGDADGDDFRVLAIESQLAYNRSLANSALSGDVLPPLKMISSAAWSSIASCLVAPSAFRNLSSINKLVNYQTSASSNSTAATRPVINAPSTKPSPIFNVFVRSSFVSKMGSNRSVAKMRSMR